MELPKVYEPKQVEKKIYTLWEKSGFFNPDKLPKSHRKPFTIVIPPPNITGSLHMGHALNTIIQDILIRFKRMQGFKTLWLPGTDHAGIATQNVVEKELKKEGLTRFELGREKFVKRTWQWKEKYGNIILDQLKKLGASCDWSRTRFTLDKEYAQAVETAFEHYFKKGWVYQSEKVINWCPRCRTSLSDLEIEYKEEKGNLWYIRYPLKKIQNSKFEIRNSFIVVATTRPETMLGDSAVAVNPKDERYKDFIGEEVILPIQNRIIPIIVDDLVDLNFGTGAVKVTPAHDLTDFEIGLKHGLKSYKIIEESAQMTSVAGKDFKGLNIYECRNKVIEKLKELKLLDKVEPYSHRVAKCYRCGTTIEPLPSKQWFLKMDSLARIAIRSVRSNKIKFIPKKWEKLYFDWLADIKDWCISRQIWWGHRIPIWQCQRGALKLKIKNKKLKIFDNKYFFSLKNPKKCPVCKNCQPEQIPDVLDTWFSSALWPFATLGWPAKTSKNDLQKFYPTDILITARDIINLWVTRMIFSAIEFTKKVPFKKVLIHSVVLTKEGKRMSKSLGTGIDPLYLIEKYGADATRFGIIWQETGAQDIHFGEEPIIAGQKFCNKLWNASRFVLTKISKSQIPSSKLQIKNFKNLTNGDKKILEEVAKIIKSVNKELENFRFSQALKAIYNFFWHEFCDIYIEKSKYQNTKETKQILFYILLTSLKLLHPFIPFISEEIYQKLTLKARKKSLMVEEWPSEKKIYKLL